jgi:glycosyltransferase involved in cell wall biosynthesis
MRILMLTAGAGGMYCGSCLRDNALAAELGAAGHDVTLLPIYTPTLTDETNVSASKVFFGGISVYLEQHVPLLRRTPAFLDRLWDTPAVIRALAGRSVSTDPHLLGGLTVSMLAGEQGFQAKELRKLLAWLARQPRFDVVNLPFTLLLGLAGPLKRALGCPIVCTLQGEDLFLDALHEPYRSQARAWIARHAHEVDRFLAVSTFYGEAMAQSFELPRERVRCAPLGIHVDDFAPRTQRAPGPYTIGYFARLAPEKGLHLLAEAYVHLRRELGLPAARLVAGGYLGPDQQAYVAGIEARLAAAGLGDEFTCHGTLARAAKRALLQSFDVLAAPSPYIEPKGLYVLEALASGVPVVAPRHGAFIEILERTGGGLFFTPHDAADLARVLRALHDDDAQAAELGRRGAAGVRAHYGADAMARAVLATFAELGAC